MPDFEKVKEYYGNLGFEVVWERKPEGPKGYLVMKMDQNVLFILQPWGLQDFRAVDPFGYYLRFNENHDILDRGNAVP